MKDAVNLTRTRPPGPPVGRDFMQVSAFSATLLESPPTSIMSPEEERSRIGDMDASIQVGEMRVVGNLKLRVRVLHVKA